MRKIPNQYRNLTAAKHLEEAQSKFDADAAALVTANRSARAAGKRFIPEMQEAAERLSASQQKLQEAQAAFDLATGGPEPVELTPLILKKVEESFPPDQQLDVISMLKKECAHNLPFCEDDTAQELERVRPAVVKNSGGNLAELRRQIELAKRDGRDVLSSAEYPEASRMGFVSYSKLDKESRMGVEARDRQQYEAWLKGENDQHSSPD